MNQERDKTGGRRLLFDKLTNETPETQEETPIKLNYSRAELFFSVKRELTDLLNDRCKLSWSQYDKSDSIPYGFPDVYGLLDAAADKAGAELPVKVAKNIKAAIERFEPRLQNVVVEPRKDQQHFTFLFNISGDLIVAGKVERFSFPITIDDRTRKQAGDEDRVYNTTESDLKWPKGKGIASVDKV